MTLLEVRSVSKAYGSAEVLRDVSFHVSEGEIVCLLGPSGCGKTTLLRIVAGLEAADSGTTHFDDEDLGTIPVHRRGFGLMFQDYALFPHKDVAANVAFGLRMRSISRQQVVERVSEMLDLVGLEGYERRRVFELSGGEQQRVALARSLAPGPQLLMLDEPLGSLDRALREELMNELRMILKQVGVTTVYVTHDQQEAFALADQVLIMNEGSIVQEGTPRTVYRHPASAWVAQFLGLTNLVKGRVTATDPCQVDTALGRFSVHKPERATMGQEITLLVRPEAASIIPATAGASGNLVTATVQECSFRGNHYRLVVRHATGAELSFELVSDQADPAQPGEVITLALRSGALSLLQEEGIAAGMGEPSAAPSGKGTKDG